MARLYDDANTQYIESATVAVAAYPISMAGWFCTDDVTKTQSIVSECLLINNNQRITLVFGGAIAGDPVQYFIQNAAASAGPLSTTGATVNVWAHACGVSAANNDHRVYINGGSKGTSASAVNFPATVTRTSIGRDAMSPAANYFSGKLAEVAIWSVALTDAEVAILASGVSPLLVQPASLVSYWPLIGRYSPEIDVAGGNGMTLSASAPVVADHPRVRYPG